MLLCAVFVWFKGFLLMLLVVVRGGLFIMRGFVVCGYFAVIVCCLVLCICLFTCWLLITCCAVDCCLFCFMFAV